MNQFRKMVILLIAVVIVQFGVLAYVFYTSQQDRALMKKVKESVDNTVNYDQKISASEKRMLDSLKVLRTALQQTKDRQRNENTRLRQQNQRIQDDFDRLDLSDRPDF